MGLIMAASPIIKPVSAIIEPTALPSAKSGLPLSAANTETDTSGNVVPSDTIVAPIIAFGILIFAEIATASSIRISAPLLKVSKDTAIIAKSATRGNGAMKL